MTTIKFQQIKPSRAVVFILIYFTFMLILLFGVFGFNEVVAFVNSFKNTKVIGILGAVLFLVPIVLLSRFIYSNIELVLNDNSITVNTKKEQKVIPFATIEQIWINKTKAGSMDLVNSQNEILCNFRPYNRSEIIGELVKAITAEIVFTKKVEQRKATGGSADIITYSQVK